MTSIKPIFDIVADETITDADYQAGTDYHRYEINISPSGVYTVTVNGLGRGTYTTKCEAEKRVVELKVDYQTYLKTPALKTLMRAAK